MLHIASDCDLEPHYCPNEPLSPVKPGAMTIDLSDLLSSKTPQTPSCLSLFDTTSVRFDEESSRPLLTIETRGRKAARAGKLKNAEKKTEEVLGVDDPKITIAEIISHRTFTRRQKDPNKEKNIAEMKGKGRKRSARKEQDLDASFDDVVMKKEKLEIVKSGSLLKMNEQMTVESSTVPEIMIKDGKVQMIMKEVQTEVKPAKPLEIVIQEKKKVTTSTSFRQLNHTEKWSEKETEKFYRALRLFGTDFSMIAKVFKNRNRNQVKNKFLKEEKCSAHKVNDAFKNFTPINLQNLIKKAQKYKNQAAVSINSQSSLSITEASTCNSTQVKSQNLLLALPNPSENLEIKRENLTQDSSPIVEINEEAEQTRSRSDSFESHDSTDSIDREIIEDLADILVPVPTKKLLLN